MPKAKAKLTINLEYDGEDVSAKTIRALLDDLVWHAASNGLFSGEFDMEVDSYEHTVEVEREET